MKKQAAMSLLVFFALSTLQVGAQEQVRSEIKSVKESKKELKKELSTLRNSLVSQATLTQFLADFGYVLDVKWEKEKNLDEATFTLDGQVVKAYYDFNSVLVGTTTNKTFEDLPLTGQKRINLKYEGYTPGTVLFFKENEAYNNTVDMALYGARFEHLDHYFVVLSKDTEKIVVMVSKEGDVLFLTNF
jgi:hypothetical protein